ncbi:conserved hypothetical protein [Zunongwangia profunda SM-A87]|uniref:3-keto-alpha-glucoside-1,2-lyase/3-keto-2-hydroxy-glucal hydratase domain-containing protein n=1 Tax=Zunongwangia profunda (strain DSM 18752 / CCTCC AB 206139 / SM-A87) TaxID=655815 RepID=D5BEH3_ZUNPS|nr:DUF1080 domain-containing protein [Zunongwangia profunda]ADF54958.1 conserved hypothetical protein [Zunongwangia profunda SM-A87]
MKRKISSSGITKTINLQLAALFISGTVLIGCGESKKKSSDEETVDTAANTEETVAATSPNQLSEKEKEEGWKLLFDGKSTDGWRGYLKDSFPEKGWIIEDGALKVQGAGTGEAGNGGDIIFDEEFKDFELSLEWKISEGGNSGIFYLAEEIEGEPIFTSAPEMQILDNDRHPDAKLGKDGNRQAGSLYDLIPARPQNAKPVGEWNKVSVLVYRGTVVHTQNGENVVEYHLWTDEWKEMIKDSKFKDWKSFLNAGGDDKKGYIGLQDHGDDVWFRNIKIKEL